MHIRRLVNHMDKRELLWNQYQQNIDLYKFYMDLTVKFNIFFYAVTGAIVSYVLAKHKSNDLIQYALILPLAMSFCFALFFSYGAYLMGILRSHTFIIRDTLNLQVAPDVGVLSILLCLFAFIFFLIFLGCLVLICTL